MVTTSETPNKAYPPCRRACPAGINVQAYIALISQGKFTEALESIRRSIPFPSVCGRVCFSPCEDACTRKDIDEPLSIRSLKRMVADYKSTLGGEKAQPVAKTRNEKIAIVGSGPAGLTAGYELAKKGYPVTVFESKQKPGGSLRYYIPEYRLPKRVLDEEIRYIKETGVEIRTGIDIGKDTTIEELLRKGFCAVFLATGAHREINLNVPGESLSGVFHALDFLENVHVGNSIDLGTKVAVVGGGNTAIDAARTARRLSQGEVTVVYRRTEKEMPAHHKEIEEAREEGVKILFLASPKRFLGEGGKLIGIECIRNELGSPDSTGRRRPVPIEGSEFVLPVDSALLGIGEWPDVSFLPEEVEVTKGNRIVADEVTLETGLPGVFAGGDATTGTASVIQAIAAGKKAAVSIDRHIKGLDLRAGRTEEVPELAWISEPDTQEKRSRQEIPCLEPEKRVKCFEEVELGLPISGGLAESHRCLFCGPCSECLEKENLCEVDTALVDEDRCIACANCEKACDYGAIRIGKSVAKVDPMLCKGCGTCVAECPAEAISMQSFTDRKILTQIDGIARSSKAKKEPRILAFSCDWSHSEGELGWPRNAHVVPVRCSGRVDPQHVLRAFMVGADGVMIVGCDPKDCHYVFGSSIAEKRVTQIRKWLQSIGINPERLQKEQIAVGNEKHLHEALDSFLIKLKELGPTGLEA